MRRATFEILAVLLPLAAGAGLALVPTAAPGLLAPVASGAAAVGMLVAALVVARALRAPVPLGVGFLALIGGLGLMALTTALPAWPARMAWLAARTAGGSLSAGQLMHVLQAVAALEVGLGSALWMRRLLDRWVLAQVSKGTLEQGVRHLKERMRSQAEHLEELDVIDGLTGALRRRAFAVSTGHAIQRDASIGEPFAFLMVRVARHREVAVDEGQEAADRLVREVARALRAATRGTDTVGRLRAEAFGVFLGECQDPGPALERILFALEGGPGARKRNPVQVQIAAVTVVEPGDPPAFTDLLQAAEAHLAGMADEDLSHVSRIALDRDRATGTDPV